MQKDEKRRRQIPLLRDYITQLITKISPTQPPKLRTKIEAHWLATDMGHPTPYRMEYRCKFQEYRNEAQFTIYFVNDIEAECRCLVIPLDKYDRQKKPSTFCELSDNLLAADIDSIAKKLKAVLETVVGEPKEKRITNTASLSPQRFSADNIVTQSDRTTYSICNHAIAHCKVVMIATINNKLVVNDDITGYNADCWFVLDCSGSYRTGGKDFSLLVREVDGVWVWYLAFSSFSSARNKRVYKITDMYERSECDYRLVMSKIDEQLVVAAIDEYMRKR